MKKEKKPTSYKIEPLEKKSVIQTTTYKKGDDVISREETYRWGYAVVNTSKNMNTKSNEITVTDYDFIEHSYEDGTSLFWDFPQDMSDEEREAIENTYQDDGDDGLEELGWIYINNEDRILAPFKITKVK
jgi:hypothetical protein